MIFIIFLLIYANNVKYILYYFLLKDAPVKAKKVKNQEVHKLKKMITRSLNNAMEDELRESVLEGKKSLTKKNSSSLKKK